MKKTYRGKRAPKGFHFMTGGKLMKDSAHGVKGKPTNVSTMVRRRKGGKKKKT